MENRLIFSLLASLCLIIPIAAANPETEDAVVTDDASNPENVDFGMPGKGQKMPSPSELLKMLDSMTGMSEEDKESLRQDLLRNIQGQGSQQFPQQAGSDFFGQTAMLLGFLSLLALIFGKHNSYFCF